MLRPNAAAAVPLMMRLRQMRAHDLAVLARRALDMPTNDSAAYDAALLASVPVAHLQTIATSIRGDNYRPAVIVHVHGAMPRSGTNYVADLLQLHQDIAAYPHRLWELPLLHCAGAISSAQAELVRTYKRNAEVVAPYEFLTYLASGLLSYLQRLAGDSRTVLLKVPHADYLYLFHAIFPRDHCVLVLRDGRDAVASHIDTFGSNPLKPGITELSSKLARAAHLMLDYARLRATSPGQHALIRYEDANHNPVDTLRGLLATLALPEARIDFANVGTLPVRGSSALQGKTGVNWDPQAKPKDFQPVGRWHAWKQSQRRRFKRHAATTLIAAGYAAG